MPDQSLRWRCTVCGYVHQGATPCACCPICGASPDLFEPCTTSVMPVEPQAIDRWRCLNCEYIHSGPRPPERCPLCAAATERFEPLIEVEAIPPALQQELEIIIVGAGIAGVSAAEAARENAPKSRITLISREENLPYYRLNLTRYLAAEIDSSELPIHPQSWYAANDIKLLCGTELRAIDPQRKIVSLRGAGELTYDKLILALGSHPFVPPFPGGNRENVTVLRTRRDADFILGQIQAGGLPCVVIGGGLLGLETAGALAKRKSDVTLIEGYDWLMPQQLNRNAGERLAREAAKLGIKFRLGGRIKQLEGDERVRGVVLETGEILPAELVLITAGVRTNSYLARLAQLETNNGIVVNNALQTNNSDIYAVGDVAEHHGVCYGTWGPAQFQGTIAGLNAAGGKIEFAGIPRSNSLKVLECELFSIGQIKPEDGSYCEIEETLDDNYFYFLFRDSRLVGTILLGDTRLSASVKHLIEKKIQCSELLAKKIVGEPVCAQLESVRTS